MYMPSTKAQTISAVFLQKIFLQKHTGDHRCYFTVIFPNAPNPQIAGVVLVIGFLALVLWKWCQRKRTTPIGDNEAQVRTAAAHDEAEDAVDLEKGGSLEVVTVSLAAEAANAPVPEGGCAAAVLPTAAPPVTEVSRAADIEEGGAPARPFPANVQEKDDHRSGEEQHTAVGAAASSEAECTVEPAPTATAAAPPLSEDIDETPRRQGLQERQRALALRRATLEAGAAEASRRELEAQEKIDELSALHVATTDRLNHDRAVGEAQQDELRSQLRAERASDHAAEIFERAEVEEWEGRAVRAEQHAGELEHDLAEQEHEVSSRGYFRQLRIYSLCSWARDIVREQ